MFIFQSVRSCTLRYYGSLRRHVNADDLSLRHRSKIPPLSVHPRIRRLARLVVPDFLRTWRAERWRIRVSAATTRLSDFADGQVLGGPFKGMKYVARAHSSQLGPKLLGTYELELFATFDRLLQRTDSQVIDVGAAEGYYAVGILFRAPTARCTAFEGSPEARRDLEELARRNGVTQRLTIEGYATPSLLEAALRDQHNPIVIVDVDGAELELIDPHKVPSLSRADLIIEVHPHLLPNVREQLEARLRASHALKFLPAVHRDEVPLPALPSFAPRDLRALMWEARPDGQGWLIGTPKSRPMSRAVE